MIEPMLPVAWRVLVVLKDVRLRRGVGWLTPMRTTLVRDILLMVVVCGV